MSQTALEVLAQAKAALELVLDGTDMRLIDARCENFRSAIFAVRAVGAWLQDPELVRMAADMLGRVEAAQQRVRNLTRESGDGGAAGRVDHKCASPRQQPRTSDALIARRSAC